MSDPRLAVAAAAAPLSGRAERCSCGPSRGATATEMGCGPGRGAARWMRRVVWGLSLRADDARGSPRSGGQLAWQLSSSSPPTRLAPRRRYRSVAPKDIDKYAFMEGFKLLLSESAEVRHRHACWPA